MKTTISLLALFLCLLSVPVCLHAQDDAPEVKDPEVKELPPVQGLPAEGEIALTTDVQKGSYAFGMNLGRSLGPAAKQLDLDVFFHAVRKSIEGKEHLMTEEEAKNAFVAFQTTAVAAANKRSLDEGQAFLKANLEKDKDIVQLASGLQYKVLKKGEGTSPKLGETVKVHYTGTMIDGTKFDSSRDRGQPAEFELGLVVPGWNEGLQLMKPGSQWILYLPADLGYGERGNQRIPPNSVLIFDVELIEVK